jgi:hypothetical protein
VATQALGSRVDGSELRGSCGYATIRERAHMVRCQLVGFMVGRLGAARWLSGYVRRVSREGLVGGRDRIAGRAVLTGSWGINLNGKCEKSEWSEWDAPGNLNGFPNPNSDREGGLVTGIRR